MADLNAELLTHLESGGTVVTATRRQARLLLRAHDSAQRRAGRRVWRTADVLPLDSWLERSWFDGGGRRDERLLAPPQAQWLWRQEVERSLENTLIGSRDLAGTARASWIDRKSVV